MLRGVEGIRFVQFDDRDVVRHSLVQKIVKAYERYNELIGVNRQLSLRLTEPSADAAGSSPWPRALLPQPKRPWLKAAVYGNTQRNLHLFPSSQCGRSPTCRT